ncbi:MAG TPA: SNF2 helicase associated domain-containing protein, partial [Blastocatellia bacterium]|nr:SNF2 helicase associated domain-containing protein [Blastocatellia bacterium]
MSIVKKFSQSFSSAIRSRGLDYYMKGRVRMVGSAPGFVHAVVRGTTDYTVRLELRGRNLHVSCTCPYYEDDACKHVWATMLAAGSKGYLSGSNPQRLVMGDRNDSGDYDEGDRFDDEDDLYDDEPYGEGPELRAGPRPAPAQEKAGGPSWRNHLSRLGHSMKREAGQPSDAWPSGREILYVVNHWSAGSQGVVTEVNYREKKKNGDWSTLKSQRLPYSQISKLPDPADREILSLMMGAKDQAQYYGYSNSDYESVPARQRLLHPLDQLLIPMMCRTGRCYLRLSQYEELRPAPWDDGPPWELWLEVRPSRASRRYVIIASLRRGDDRMDLSDPSAMLKGGLVFARDRMARLEDFGAFDWITQLQKEGPVYVPVKEADQLLQELLTLPALPRLDLPEELRFEERPAIPKSRLKIRKPENQRWGPDVLHAELSFDYEGEIIRDGHPGRGLYRPAGRQVILRDAAAEQAAADYLRQLGFRKAYDHHSTRLFHLAPGKLPGVVKKLVSDDWYVEAEGKLYRQPGEIRAEIKSEIDWFEMRGTVSYGDATASLPELLAALKRGENTVRLGDGTFGVLSEEWLGKYGMFVELGAAGGDHLRFSRAQVSLLDALLASEPEIAFDETFARVRGELGSFKGIKAADPSPGFKGELREYQRE